ncbi:Ig-like domain-containing protein [Acerihabitans sp. KWT182]|uniref:Ig-like domain-containing protein n=1 Tax=Acerihabitans sp. KWT182 TaxID=3157919 RepID=A0AAU7QCP0_9GAMM
MSEYYQAPNSPGEFDDFIITVTSNALADGQSVNSATVRIYRHGAPLCGACLDFEVTKNARFTNGAPCQSVPTDECGRATVFFTDTVAEDTVVICRFKDAIGFRSSTFVGTDIDISVEVWVNNAPGNSPSGNQLFYRVFNVDTNQSVAGALVDFTVSGQATLSPNPGITNHEGIFLLSVFNPTAGTVLVNAQVRGYPNADNHTFVTYSAVLPQYSLTAEVLAERPDGATPVIYRLVDLSTGLPVPGQRLRVYCGQGATRTLLETTSPTAEDGTVTSGYYVAYNAINHMLVVMDIDDTVNYGFELRGRDQLLP